MNSPNGNQPDMSAIEVAFWKQKYFELLTHSNQVIAMLAMTQQNGVMPPMPQPPAQPPMPSQNGAQNGVQPQESPSGK